MFFRKPENETPLTEAVIKNDVAEVRKLKNSKDQVLATNFLGFNSIELARYLDRRECLDILDPQPKKSFKVRSRGSSKVEVFSHEQFEEFFNIRYVRHLVFPDYQLFKRVVQSCASIFLKELEDKNGMTPEKLKEYEMRPEFFTLMTHVYRKKIYSGYFVPSTVEWIDDILEYGLFADKDIKKGEYVGEFIGEMRRWAFWSLENDYYFYYPNKAWQNYAVDPTFIGNEMRFCNHSFKPNLETLVAADKGLLHLVYLTARDISKGEQLTWNYGEDFWSKREPPQEI